VPATAGLGTSQARFRVSRVGSTTPVGLIVDGEVEDYAVRVLSNSPPFVVNPIGPRTALEDGPDVVVSLANVFNDIDITNGNNDFLTFSASTDSPSVAWLRSASWERS
jgi:hypothetical protein